MGCYGQDWASYQSPAPSVTGLSFVFVKRTEGLTYVNPRGAAQVSYARQYKLVVGHYHYPHMGNDPAAECDFFLRTAQVEPGDVVALDWEGYDAANRGVPFSRQAAYKAAFLSRLAVRLPHNQCGTYMNTDYLQRDPQGPVGDFLWIATANRPAGSPGIARPWLFHQYAASGVDKDYCSLPAHALREWAHAKEDDMPLTQDDIDKVAEATMWKILTYRNQTADAASVQAGHGHIPDVYGYTADTNAKVSKLTVGGVDLDLLATKVADLLAARLKS